MPEQRINNVESFTSRYLEKAFYLVISAIIHWTTLYVMFHDEFKIPHYEELLAVDFEKAIKFMQSVGKVIESKLKSRFANDPENLDKGIAPKEAVFTETEK